MQPQIPPIPTAIPKASIQSTPTQAVLVSNGTELYNLGQNRQLNYFTVLDQSSGEWLSYQIPSITLADQKQRESCAIVGQPYLHTDGTIYIAAAGGVLNRFTPEGTGYRHDYAIFDGRQTPTFTTNPQPATLLARGHEPVCDPLVMRSVDGVEQPRPFFQSYREQRADFNMLVEQGLVSPEKQQAIWSRAKRPINGMPCSINDALAHIKTRPAPEAEVYRAGLLGKNGPLKDEVLRLWERNNDKFPAKEGITPVQQALEKLAPDLGSQCHLQTNNATPEEQQSYIAMQKKGRLFTGKGSWKIYDERLAIRRGALCEIPDQPNQLGFAVAGQLYQIDHGTGTITALGTLPSDHQPVAMLANDGTPTGEQQIPEVDPRGLIALGNGHFLIGDMGLDETVNGARTLQIVKCVDSGTVSACEALTSQLLETLQNHWTTENQPNKTPRVKSLIAGKERVIAGQPDQTTLYIRTKHASNDLLKVPVQFENGQLNVGMVEALQLSDTVNCEYFSVVGNTLIASRETEDYTRTGYLPSVRHHLESFAAKTTSDVQKPQGILPELPRWQFYTGYGYGGITVR